MSCEEEGAPKPPATASAYASNTTRNGLDGGSGGAGGGSLHGDHTSTGFTTAEKTRGPRRRLRAAGEGVAIRARKRREGHQ